MERSTFRRGIILGTERKPLIVLEKYRLELSSKAKEAREELSNLLKRNAGSSHTWGYFPQINGSDLTYKDCIALGKTIQERLIENLPFPERLMSLAFIRLATDTPISSHGGVHIDVDKGINHNRDVNIQQNQDIIRLILNLGDSSRTLEYIPFTKDELREMGHFISDEQYRILDLNGLPKNRIEIPSRKEDYVYGLKFWSSQVPHAGITDEKGHFLAAFGGYANMSSHSI